MVWIYPALLVLLSHVDITPWKDSQLWVVSLLEALRITTKADGLRVFASWYDKTPKEARSCFIKGVPLKKRWPRKVYSDVLKASGIFDHNLCIGSIEHLVVFPTTLQWAAWAITPSYKPLPLVFWEDLRRECISIIANESESDSDDGGELEAEGMLEIHDFRPLVSELT